MSQPVDNKIILGLRIIGTILFSMLVLLFNLMPFYIKVPETILLTAIFSLPIYILGLADIWGAL